MKTRNSLLYFAGIMSFAIVCAFSVPPSSALAANVPYLSLVNNSGSSLVTITVIGADPNVSALLYYPSTASYASQNIGTTNASGYLLTTIDSSTYGIAAGAPVYVIVDGQSSPQQPWPNYSSSGGLQLSQTTVSLSVGQTIAVTAPVSAPLSLSNNTNPSVANAVVSGNQINISGLTFGTSNITVCAANIGCGTIQVSVGSSGSTGQANISFSQSSITLAAGQSQQVIISGSGSYYISANSNSGVVSASISGSTLFITGVSAGTASLSVCSSNGGSTICGSVNVTVTYSTVTTNTTTTSSLSFSQSSVNLVVGQNQSVSIYGGTNSSTVYYITNNSGPNAVSANVNGMSVGVTGIAFGGSNITVCQSGGPCGTFYVYVASANTTAAPATSVTTAPALSSFSVSSNDAGGSFAGSSSALTITFSTNQTINTPTATVNGSAVTVSGSGSGPYTASYTIPANALAPLPVALTFTNPAGSGGQAYFWISNYASASPAPISAAAPVVATVASCPSGYTCTAQPNATAPTASATTPSGGAYSFDNYLYMGMTKIGVADPDVAALQKRLAVDGIYLGPITGYFGPQTKIAVKAYQTKHGLSPIGVVGPSTRNLLNEGI